MLKKIWEKRHGRRPDFFVVEGSQAGGHLGFEQEEVEQGNAKPLLTILKEVVKEAEDIPGICRGSVFDSEEYSKVPRCRSKRGTDRNPIYRYRGMRCF